MGKNLKAIQNMKREHAQLLRALNRDKVKLGKLKKTQSIHEVDFAQRRIDAAREKELTWTGMMAAPTRS